MSFKPSHFFLSLVDCYIMLCFFFSYIHPMLFFDILSEGQRWFLFLGSSVSVHFSDIWRALVDKPHYARRLFRIVALFCVLFNISKNSTWHLFSMKDKYFLPLEVFLGVYPGMCLIFRKKICFCKIPNGSIWKSSIFTASSWLSNTGVRLPGAPWVDLPLKHRVVWVSCFKIGS